MQEGDLSESRGSKSILLWGVSMYLTEGELEIPDHL